MWDFCVIGGGIVGLASALRLLEAFPGSRLVLLEKEATLARHQTGHNSGVIHSGIYYAPGSLKARLCREGAAQTKAFCAAHDIPVETCGKLIVATDALELRRMDDLLERAAQNGIACERLDAEELARREPNIRGLGAIFVPATAIVDYKRVCAAMAGRIAELGGCIECGMQVDAIEETADKVVVRAGGRIHEAGHLVVCAGLQADRLVKLAGLPCDFQIVPFRGEYFDLPAHRTGLISALIYPVPDPALPFLGIHLTRTIDGGITLGPNAVLGLAREGYAKTAVDWRDVATSLRFPGLWRTLRKNWRSAIRELRDSLWRRGYLAACRKYCPGLTLADLRPREAGIRAQAVLRDGTLVHDFLFVRSARSLHVCNAPSPAATSALPIGQMIVEEITAQRAHLADAIELSPVEARA
jgi:L-2-hydroxyglutarate oxidase